jgi:hypothetical protein
MSDYQNPYAARTVMAHDYSIPAISQDGLRAGSVSRSGNVTLSSGPAFGANGELNASSNLELMRSVAAVLKQAQTQTVRAASPEQAQMRLAELKDAFADKSGAKFQVLGEVISEEIWETLGREGFSRKLFAVSPVGAGQTPRIKVRKKDIVAYQVTADVKVQEQRIRQTYVYPARYSLVSNIAIEDAEIAQAGTELLDEKLN